METIRLFKSAEGEWLTNVDLFNSLQKLKAAECDILYIHSSLSFGIPNQELRRSDLLASILDVIRELKVSTICMPTFTFSYCNKQIYDKQNSRSKMGALNEFFRKQNNVIRSNDPLMSVAVSGRNTCLANGISTHSIGDNSTFDILHHTSNVKFLFLGTKMGDCFTYMHYLEWLFGVPYRYERRFTGSSVLDGNIKRNEFDLFVRYKGVYPNSGSYDYEEKMYASNKALRGKFGDSSISVVDEKAATLTYLECLQNDTFFFVNIEDKAYYKDKTFLLDKEMVAL